MIKTREYEIADLHEDILQFLLGFRQEQDSRLYFFLRPADNRHDQEALQKGWWFPGNDRYVNIYFAESLSERYYENNFKLSVNKQGQWFGEIQIGQENTEKTVQTAKEFMLNFKHLSANGGSKSDRHIRRSTDVVLEPKDRYYRNGFPEVLKLLSKVQEDYHTSFRNWIAPIRAADFEKRLDLINTYRRSDSKIALSGMSIAGFHGLKETALSNLPIEAPWIFLTGENGFGKSSLLQAIAIGLYGNTEESIIPTKKDFHIEISYQWKNKARIIHHDNNTEEVSFFRPLENLACYGPARLQLQSHQSRNEELKSSTATYSLFNLDGALRSIEYELLISYYDNRNKFLMLEDLLKAVIPSLHKVEVDKNRQILYHEKNEADDTSVYEPVTFEKLASGIRSIIAMVGDIYLRLSEKLDVQKQQEIKEQNRDFIKAHDLNGIVIIDELDLHLHPDWQYKLPGLLSKVFPKIQFIASTHSPIPLLGAPTESIFLKVERSKEAGIIVKKLEVDVSSLTPNLILNSEIFGFHNIIANSNVDQSKVRTEDTMQEKEFRDELKKRLMKFAEEEGDYPDNLFKS